MTRHRTIVISGLRRSGTTALWECFRHHESIAAFDEPFHPQLAAGARSNTKGTWRELGAFLDAASGIRPAAILPLDELSPHTSTAQSAFWEQLTHAKEHVAIDVVRCWNRLPDLYHDRDNTLTVQLVRDPLSWVTGHLLPSGKGTWKKAVADNYRRISFFTRSGFFDNYHYETIIAEALRQNHSVWDCVTPTATEIAQAPAYVKLLAFWWGTNVTLHHALRKASAPRMLTTLQDLSTDPNGVLGQISDAAGWPLGWLSADHIKATREAVGSQSKHWNEAAEFLGIPTEIMQSGNAGTATLEGAFDKASMRQGCDS